MTDITWTHSVSLHFDELSDEDISLSSTKASARSTWSSAEERLLSLRRLGDNWDGMDASAPEPEVVDVALRFLKHQRERGADAPSRVSAGPNGEIAFEWQFEGIVLHAEIDEPGKILWILKEPGNPATSWEDEFDKSNQDELWGTSEIFETLAPDSAAA